MKEALFRTNIVIKRSPIHRYGVFAEQDFLQDDIIEECHTLLVREQTADLHNYFFSGKKNSVLALGFGSIYNHAEDPNASFQFDAEHDVMVFRARKKIKKGEEIFISYGKQWFSSRQMPIKKLSKKFIFKKLFFPTLRFGIIFSGIIFFVALVKQFSIVPFKFF